MRAHDCLYKTKDKTKAHREHFYEEAIISNWTEAKHIAHKNTHKYSDKQIGRGTNLFDP